MTQETSQLIVALVAIVLAFGAGFICAERLNQAKRSQDLSRFDKIEEILLNREYIAPKFD